MRSFLLPLLLVLAGPAAASPVDLDTPVPLTVRDLLGLYSAVLTNNMLIELRGSEEAQYFSSMEVVLADADGRLHVNLVMTSPWMRQIQRVPPAQQMAALEALRVAMAQPIVTAISGMGQPDAFSNIDRGASSADGILQRYFSDLKAADVVLGLALEKDGKTHLYASVTAAGTTFNPEAPAL